MKNKKTYTIIVTSALCLLPVVMSLAVYGGLPEQIPIHWDYSGNPDNFLPKAAAAFGIPFLLALANILTKIFIFNDPKRASASAAMQTFSTWLIPAMSLIITPVNLLIALGAGIPVSVIIPVLTGIVLIVFGNYLPKSRQNYTIGIKLPWTLNDADNWNKTHRAAGYLYIAGGFVLIALTFLSFKNTLWNVITISIILLLLIFPVLYSFLLYKRKSL